MKKTRTTIKTTPLAFINWMLTQFEGSDWQAVSILPGKATMATPATIVAMKEKQKLSDTFYDSFLKLMALQQVEIEAIDNKVMQLEQQKEILTKNSPDDLEGIAEIQTFIEQKKKEKEELSQSHEDEIWRRQKEHKSTMDSFPEAYVSVVTFDVTLKHKKLDIEKSFQYRQGEHHSLMDLLNSVNFDGIATALTKNEQFYIRHNDKIYGFKVMSAEWSQDRSFNIAIATSTHYLCMDFPNMDQFLDLKHTKGLCNYKALIAHLLDVFEREAQPLPQDEDCSLMQWIRVYDSGEYPSTEFASLPQTIFGEFHVSWEEFLKTCSMAPTMEQSFFALPPSTTSDEYDENEALLEELSQTPENDDSVQHNDNSFGR
jgi:hypothetical protein